MELGTSLDDILSFLESKPYAALLFVDQQKFCKQYCEYPWVTEEGRVIEITPEIIDHFQIGKVPQWRFYLNGSEAHFQVGSISRDEFMESKSKLFGNRPS